MPGNRYHPPAARYCDFRHLTTLFSSQSMSLPPISNGPPRFTTSKSSASSHYDSSSCNNSSNHSSIGSATPSNGRALLDSRLRSLLSHDLALPLFQALHGRDPGKQTYLKRESRSLPDTCGDSVFEKAVTEWVLLQTQERKPKLTDSINKWINDISEQIHLESEHDVEVKTLPYFDKQMYRRVSGRGRINVLLSSKESSSTPLALLEIGCKNKYWWKKLDQAGKCLDIMIDDSNDEKLGFQDAVLSAILTFEGEDNTLGFQSRFGVFLCWPTIGKRWRMALLWHARTFDLSWASKDFGRFLRVVSSFAVWRKEDSNPDYCYLSPDVCRVGDTVSWMPSCGF